MIYLHLHLVDVDSVQVYHVHYSVRQDGTLDPCHDAMSPVYPVPIHGLWCRVHTRNNTWSNGAAAIYLPEYCEIEIHGFRCTTGAGVIFTDVVVLQ